METTLLCAVCRNSAGPDHDHVEVNAELIQFDDANKEEKYVFCDDCWASISGGWGEPV